MCDVQHIVQMKVNRLFNDLIPQSQCRESYYNFCHHIVAFIQGLSYIEYNSLCDSPIPHVHLVANSYGIYCELTRMYSRLTLYIFYIHVSNHTTFADGIVTSHRHRIYVKHESRLEHRQNILFHCRKYSLKIIFFFSSLYGNRNLVGTRALACDGDFLYIFLSCELHIYSVKYIYKETCNVKGSTAVVRCIWTTKSRSISEHIKGISSISAKLHVESSEIL